MIRRSTTAQPADLSAAKWNTQEERALRDALHNLRFGTVTLVVQDGRVIQIDRNEKFRLGNAPEQRYASGI